MVTYARLEFEPAVVVAFDVVSDRVDCHILAERVMNKIMGATKEHL